MKKTVEIHYSVNYIVEKLGRLFLKGSIWSNIQFGSKNEVAQLFFELLSLKL